MFPTTSAAEFAVHTLWNSAVKISGTTAGSQSPRSRHRYASRRSQRRRWLPGIEGVAAVRSMVAPLWVRRRSLVATDMPDVRQKIRAATTFEQYSARSTHSV